MDNIRKSKSRLTKLKQLTMKTYKSNISEISLKFNKSDFKRVRISTSEDATTVIRQFYHDDISIYESFFHSLNEQIE